MNIINNSMKAYIELLQEISDSYKISPVMMKALKTPIDDWKRKRKIARSSYIIPIFDKLSKDKNNGFIKSIFVGFDVVINTLDDTIDIMNPEKNAKLARELTKMINVLYIFQKIETGLKDSKTKQFIINYSINFIFSLSQIPFIEKEYSKKITKSRKEEVTLSVECLRERARDVDIFIDLLIFYLNIDKRYSNQLKEFVKSYRMLELFVKDYSDLNSDIKNGADTPIHALFRKYKNSEEFKDTLGKILNVLFSIFDKYKDKDDVLIFIKELAKEKYDGFKRNINS